VARGKLLAIQYMSQLAEQKVKSNRQKIYANESYGKMTEISLVNDK